MCGGRYTMLPSSPSSILLFVILFLFFFLFSICCVKNLALFFLVPPLLDLSCHIFCSDFICAGRELDVLILLSAWHHLLPSNTESWEGKIWWWWWWWQMLKGLTVWNRKHIIRNDCRRRRGYSFLKIPFILAARTVITTYFTRPCWMLWVSLYIIFLPYPL